MFSPGAFTNTLSTGRVRDCGAESNEGNIIAKITEASDAVTLQITNLDYSLDESNLRCFLINQLKPITPVVSLVFEGSSFAKVTVPDIYFAKQVVSNLHRKKIGHKRMLVSYTRDSSLTEVNTLRCQVAGLLKDVPYFTLPMYKFRELFQSRFKTSISVLDLYKMHDICTINSDKNEDKFISLRPEIINSLESSPLMEGLQHSVPYCSIHLKRDQHKGWAEQEIEPLPNVYMTISEIQKLIYPLLKDHPGDIPVATLLHCIEGQLKASILPNDRGVNLEHLICCVQGIQIQINNFGVKILGWLELNKEFSKTGPEGDISSSYTLSVNDRASSLGGSYFKTSVADPLFQISREVIELVKMSPKSTMKFNRFIPAYHNHYGKQCRVADYGYTKLIELFEALSSVVQIMGDGENRQITLTHRTQIRRFTSDLLRVLRAQGNNSVLLSQLPGIFAQTQNRSFDVTDYGVCNIIDILDGLVNSNIVVLTTVQHGKDILISMPKRKQTSSEMEKTCVFAGEMVELLQNALQYTILFQKFVRSYHYHFAYQCRLSDYGFLKLADLMDAIHGLVDLQVNNDEDKKIVLSPKVARRVFAEQCEDLIRHVTGNSKHCMKLDQVLRLHKKKYGYQIKPQTLGASDMCTAFELLPYVELKQKDKTIWLICHHNDEEFRVLCYDICKHLFQRAAFDSPSATITCDAESAAHSLPLPEAYHKTTFLSEYNARHNIHLTEPVLLAMRHAIEIYNDAGVQCIRPTAFMRFLIKIVQVLEQRTSMYLYEIKISLDIGLTTTFEFGFPNLYSVIAAYQDLFTLNNGPTQERSEVSLTVNCMLRQSSVIHCRVTQPTNQMLHDSCQTIHNNVTYTRPLAKRLGITNSYSSNANPLCNFDRQGNMFPAYFGNNGDLIQPQRINSSLLNSCGKTVGKNVAVRNTQALTHRQIFDGSFNSSGELNASLVLSDLTNISSSTAITADISLEQSSSKLWCRRQPGFNEQSNNQTPKPDTCTKEKLPFWIDPIWTARSEHQTENIKIAELKAKNIFPMLLSPYTISKNENLRRQLFHFDNHDRKIA
ncbi:LOW QUALITY PROTEIN: meiosis regulator and mRNA stability factor 1 [Drosophila ficusphila]|uniref:LOW QUALITY PROTEIN: meiosis regulator and mRNA stability factor 1 n=1 Tax=Drosophila ficusphila TaxID=30025 RepID=UPI001C89CCA9|nr:LOW QUALITY PROTEIN: meiosis regulator and mRNA stability factor 1 [Drosophila ficusphila]